MRISAVVDSSCHSPSPFREAEEAVRVTVVVGVGAAPPYDAHRPAILGRDPHAPLPVRESPIGVDVVIPYVYLGKREPSLAYPPHAVDDAKGVRHPRLPAVSHKRTNGPPRGRDRGDTNA